MENQKPMAALIRENAILIEIVTKAIRLRNIGKLADQIDEAYEEMYNNTNGRLGRSGTMRLLHDQAFETALKEFDEAVLAAVEKRMDWASSWESATPLDIKPDTTD